MASQALKKGLFWQLRVFCQVSLPSAVTASYQMTWLRLQCCCRAALSVLDGASSQSSYTSSCQMGMR